MKGVPSWIPLIGDKKKFLRAIIVYPNKRVVMQKVEGNMPTFTLSDGKNQLKRTSLPDRPTGRWQRSWRTMRIGTAPLNTIERPCHTGSSTIPSETIFTWADSISGAVNGRQPSRSSFKPWIWAMTRRGICRHFTLSTNRKGIWTNSTRSIRRSPAGSRCLHE